MTTASGLVQLALVVSAFGIGMGALWFARRAH